MLWIYEGVSIRLPKPDLSVGNKLSVNPGYMQWYEHITVPMFRLIPLQNVMAIGKRQLAFSADWSRKRDAYTVSLALTDTNGSDIMVIISENLE
jgi:hypothetical protein